MPGFAGISAVVSRLTKSSCPWEEKLHLLLRWRDDPEGGAGVTCNVPYSLRGYGEDRVDLGSWLQVQRERLAASLRPGDAAKRPTLYQGIDLTLPLPAKHLSILEALARECSLDLKVTIPERVEWEANYSRLLLVRDACRAKEGAAKCLSPSSLGNEKSLPGEQRVALRAWLEQQLILLDQGMLPADQGVKLQCLVEAGYLPLSASNNFGTADIAQNISLSTSSTAEELRAGQGSTRDSKDALVGQPATQDLRRLSPGSPFLQPREPPWPAAPVDGGRSDRELLLSSGNSSGYLTLPLGSTCVSLKASGKKRKSSPALHGASAPENDEAKKKQKNSQTHHFGGEITATESPENTQKKKPFTDSASVTVVVASHEQQRQKHQQHVSDSNVRVAAVARTNGSKLEVLRGEARHPELPLGRRDIAADAAAAGSSSRKDRAAQMQIQRTIGDLRQQQRPLLRRNLRSQQGNTETEEIEDDLQ